MRRSSRPSDELYRRVLDSIHIGREHPGISPTRAAREAGTTLPTARRHARAAFVKEGRRYRIKRGDQLRRDLIFYDDRGQITLVTHSSKTASEIGRYHNAVRAYLIYGDDSALQEFEDKSIVVGDIEYKYLTDRRTLSRLARAGELNILDIYKK